MGLRVNEVVKHGSSRRKLDGLEFSYPPLREFHSVIDKLSNESMDIPYFGSKVNVMVKAIALCIRYRREWSCLVLHSVLGGYCPNSPLGYLS